jgi:hypothetical protein
LNERQHDRGALTAAIGAGEEPRLPPESNSAQLALRRIVAEADAPVIEEAREDVDALSLRRAAKRSAGEEPLIERSGAKMASNFCTASNAIGAPCCGRPPRCRSRANEQVPAVGDGVQDAVQRGIVLQREAGPA